MKIEFIKREIVKVFSWTLIITLTYVLSISIFTGSEIKLGNLLRSNINIALLLLVPALIPFGTLSLALNRSVIVLFAGLVLFELAHLVVFSTRPTLNVFYTTFETQVSEAGEFFETYLLNLKTAVLCVLPSGWYVLARKANQLFLKVRLIGTALICASVLNFGYVVHTGFANRIGKIIEVTPFYAISAGIQYYDEVSKLELGSRTSPPENYVKKSADYLDEHIVVILIGESTSRRHMGVYGYSRETTPYLSKRGEELIFFNNIVSPHSHTKPSLDKVLTFKNHDIAPPPDSPSLVELAKLAGHKTYWISNQIPLGRFETPTTSVAKSADKTYFMNLSEDFRNSVHDGVLIEPFSKALQDPSQRSTIFVHLMGAHAAYENRFPGSFAKFVGQISRVNGLTENQINSINNYDNAILYNDWVVEQILTKLEQLPIKNKILFYLADHGEEVFEFRRFSGHTEVIQSNYMFEIPFVFWMSKDHEHRERFSKVSHARRNSIYSVEDFIHTYHDVVGIRSRDYLAERSLLSESFKELPRKVGSVIYNPYENYEIKQDARENDVRFGPKYMVHSVNTLEDFNAVSKDFEAFVVDVVHDQGKNSFYAYQPPVASIGPSLEEFFKLDSRKRLSFWLNMKNLTPENVLRIIELLSKYQLKHRIIFESSSGDPLKIVAKEGYMTSLYLPTFIGPKRADEFAYMADVIPRIAYDFTAISQHYRAIGVLKQYLKRVDYLTWAADYWDSPEDRALIEKFAADEQIKIVSIHRHSVSVR